MFKVHNSVSFFLFCLLPLRLPTTHFVGYADNKHMVECSRNDRTFNSFYALLMIELQMPC